MMTKEDIGFMRRAAELAKRGTGWVNPNPLVGAVVVKDGRVIGEGWHERCGGWHAERNALRDCTESAEGATVYVTLEPCCHYGKTPPCTEALMEAGVARVVVGMTDPNPVVAGRGMQVLREAGIAVEGVEGTGEAGELLRELRGMNRVFVKYITTRKPWVVMKTAMTLDGKIAAWTGDSQWVTGEAARRRVQEMRRTYMGILVGVGTALADDPMLNCRLEGEVRQPVRIVADSRARLGMAAGGAETRLVQSAREYRTVVAHTAAAPEERLEALRARGVETMLCGEQEGRVEVGDLLRGLGERGIDSVLLEGGGALNAAFLEAGAVDEVFAFVAPKLIGGREAKTPVGGKGRERMADAIALREVEMERVGEDMLVHGLIG